MLSAAHPIAVNSRIMNWKGCGRKQSEVELKYYAGICLEGLRKATKTEFSSTCVLATVSV
jgi:hypothetical protein